MKLEIRLSFANFLSTFLGAEMLSQVRTIYGLTTAPLHSLHRERRPPRTSPPGNAAGVATFER